MLYFRDAVINLTRARLRSLLAILGIFFGTGAVVALLTTSQLATAHVLAQFKSLGTGLMAVDVSYDDHAVGSSLLSKTLGLQDISALEQGYVDQMSIAPYSDSFGSVVYRGKRQEVSLVATVDNFLRLAKLQLAEGRFISELDNHAAFMVVGSHVAEKLAQFGMTHPVGQQLLLNQTFFTVVGVLKPWINNWFVSASIDDSVIIPLNAAKLMNRNHVIRHLLLKFNESLAITPLKKQVQAAIKKMAPSARVKIRSPEKILSLIRHERSALAALLVAIGAISLLVGAIGVMNIMLISVMERQREIGIRLAVGARGRDILLMFLVESVLLTVCGGVLGVLAGMIFSYIFAIFSHWQFQWFFFPCLVGFSISVLVGIMAGLYPAIRAARLDPVVSLRAA